jgi:hypothetical protein
MEKETPPRPNLHRAGVRAHEAEAAEARRHAGTWFVFREWGKNPAKNDIANSHTMASNIRKGRYVAFRPGGAFDAVSRRTFDGTLKVFVKYNGKDTEDEIKAKASC